MFQNMGFGMFENIGFGELPPAFSPYESDSKYTINFLPVKNYIVRYPLAAMPTGREYSDYEMKMNILISSIFEYMDVYVPGSPPIKNANNILSDIEEYANFLRLVYQKTVRNETSAAWADVRERLFRGLENYRKLKDFLNAQAQQELDEMMIQASSLMSNINFDTSSEKNAFYRNTVFPLASKFSQSDQSFLKDVFVYDQDGSVSLPDLVKAATLLKPYLTPQDKATFYKIAYTMVLGPTMASNVLNYNGPHVSYADRNIAAETLAIKSQYYALRNRLVPYFDAALNDSLFSQRMDIYTNAYYDVRNVNFYVCGEVCNTLNSNFIMAVSTALDSVFVEPKQITSENILTTVKEQVELATNAVTNELVPSPIIIPGENKTVQTAKPAPQSVSLPQSKSNLGIIAFGGLLLLLLLGKKD